MGYFGRKISISIIINEPKVRVLFQSPTILFKSDLEFIWIFKMLCKLCKTYYVTLHLNTLLQIMKKTKLVTTIAFAFILFLSFNANAQKFPDLDKSPMDATAFPTDYKDAAKLAKVIYSRPQLKGRSLSELAPEGKVWRTGANEATEITFYIDMNFGKSKIKAGTYTLYAIPEKDSYTIIINKDLNVWGAYFYKSENDVARLRVPVTMADESLEAFSMVFSKSDNGITLNMGWGKLRVAVPFTK